MTSSNRSRKVRSSRKKQKINGKTLKLLQERKLEDKSSSRLAAPVAQMRKKKSARVLEKSEIEFAIKSQKTQQRMNRKSTPIKRKLRKNFKFYNEQ